ARPEHEGVVAGAAGQYVRSTAAVDIVVAAVADDGVDLRVADRLEVAAAGDDQALDISAERITDPRIHRVGALAGVLEDLVKASLDDVGVVAGAANHGVSPGATIDVVVAGVAVDRVVLRIADPLDVAAAGQRQRLQIGAQRKAHAGRDRIRAFAGVLE